jgi:hypothetical protein
MMTAPSRSSQLLARTPVFSVVCDMGRLLYSSDF